jgi:exoribonuclease II
MCYEVNGDMVFPVNMGIRLTVYVVDPDATEDDVIILEYYEDETFDVILAINDSVTYQFQNLDYDDCAESYISYTGPVLPGFNTYYFDHFIVEDQSTVEGFRY